MQENLALQLRRRRVAVGANKHSSAPDLAPRLLRKPISFDALLSVVHEFSRG
jgi:hypothetical protein